MSIEFLITSFVVVITPGTGMVYTLACALGYGMRGGFWGAFGSMLAIVPHVGAAIFGLAAVLHASAIAFQVLKLIGVAYLLYMAFKMIQDRSGLGSQAFEKQSQGKTLSVFVLVRDGILASVLNPKLSIFFMAFLPQFVDVKLSNPVLTMAMLGGTFMLMTFVTFVIIGFAAASVRDRVLSQPAVMNWMKRGFAATFVALGVRLAFANR